MSALAEDAIRRLRASPAARARPCSSSSPSWSLTLLGPWLNPNNAQALDWLHVAARAGLQSAHWFGTDRSGPRSVRPHARRRARQHRDRIGGELDQHRGRRQLWRHRRLHRRTHRSSDDAHHRNLERFAADLFRHILDRHFRAQRILAVHFDRRGRLADHGANRARPDIEHPSAGIHRRGDGLRRRHRAHHRQGTWFPTSSGRSSCMRR